jgi:hypothetical protein
MARISKALEGSIDESWTTIWWHLEETEEAIIERNDLDEKKSGKKEDETHSSRDD